jgi:flagellar basal body rod protein FlgC
MLINLLAQTPRIDATANNIANADTIGEPRGKGRIIDTRAGQILITGEPQDSYHFSVISPANSFVDNDDDNSVRGAN